MRGTSLLKGAILFGALAFANVASAVSWNNYQLGQFYDISQATDPAVRDAAHGVVFFTNATGFAISPEGHVLTNYHVYQSFGTSGTVYVEWTGGNNFRRTLQLRLLAASATYDVALYKANVTGLPFIQVDPRPARVGEDVFVIGHPNTRSLEVSFGRVLATGIVIGGRPSIEYSAQTWWGSSGSPVCDRAGNVLAIHWGWDANGRSNGRLTGVPFSLIVNAVPQIAAVVQQYGVGSTVSTGTGTTTGTTTGSGTTTGTGTGTTTGTGSGTTTTASGSTYPGIGSIARGHTLGRPGTAGRPFNPAGGASTGGSGASTGSGTGATGGGSAGSGSVAVLPLGGSASGTLTRTGDLNLFRLDVPARGDLVVTLAGPSGADFDIAVWKWDFASNRGSRAARADGQTSSETVTVRDATPGAYLVVVNSYDGVGPYTVASRLDQPTGVSGSGSGTVGTASDVLLGQGDWKLYTLTAQAGTIRVNLDGPTGADFDVYVFAGDRVDANAVVAIGDSVAADESVSFQAQAGTYTILVRSAAGSGAFALSVQR